MANYGVNINLKVIGQSRLDKALKKTEQLEKKITRLNQKGINVSSSTLKIIEKELAIKTKILKADQNILKARNAQIKANKMNAATQPVPKTGGVGSGGGGTNNAILSSALISGAFPLLFGQGPLAAAGGAIGGATGAKFGGQQGGFAGGLVGTAAVTLIQQGVTSIGELGQAMNALNPDITALSESMGIMGTIEERRLEIIEQTQGKQAALNAALEMMGDKIGDQNVQELKKFGETFQDLTNSTVLFFTKVQAQVAKLLNITIGDRDKRNIQKETTKFLQQNPNAPVFAEINKEIADLESQSLEGGGRQRIKNLEREINLLEQKKRQIAESLVIQKQEDELRVQTNQLITAGLGELEKENQINRAIIAGNEEEVRLQIQLEEFAQRIGKNYEKLLPLQQERIKNEFIANKELEKQAQKTKDLNNKYKQIGQSIKTDLIGNLRGAITGTQSLGSAFDNVLGNLKNKLIDLALDKAVTGIGDAIFGSFTGGGGGIVKNVLGSIPIIGGFFRSEGGPVQAGRPYIVGERQPELFVPKTSGTILPSVPPVLSSGSIAGGDNVTNMVTVNVDATGSSAVGNSIDAQQLGVAIGAAVKSELIKQKRPGGVLSR